MEFVVAGVAVTGGLAAGATIRQTLWPALGKVSAVVVVTGLVFFIGTRLGAATVMDEAGASLGEQAGSAFLAVMAGMTWGVIGALLSLGGMLIGWLLATRRERLG